MYCWAQIPWLLFCFLGRDTGTLQKPPVLKPPFLGLLRFANPNGLHAGGLSQSNGPAEVQCDFLVILYSRFEEKSSEIGLIMDTPSVKALLVLADLIQHKNFSQMALQRCNVNSFFQMSGLNFGRWIWGGEFSWRWISWRWIFQGPPLLEKNRIKKFDTRIRVQNFGRPKFVSKKTESKNSTQEFGFQNSGVQNSFPRIRPKFGFWRRTIPCAEFCPWAFHETTEITEELSAGLAEITGNPGNDQNHGNPGCANHTFLKQRV